MVRYKFKQSSKFGALKIISFKLLSFVLGFSEIWRKFWYFGMSESEQMKPRTILCSKRPHFQCKFYPPTNVNKHLMIMCRNSLAELENILWKLTRDFSRVQHSTS